MSDGIAFAFDQNGLQKLKNQHFKDISINFKEKLAVLPLHHINFRDRTPGLQFGSLLLLRNLTVPKMAPFQHGAFKKPFICQSVNT